MKLFYFIVIPAIIYSVLNKLFYTWLPTNYVFDPETIGKLSREAIAESSNGNVTEIVTALIPKLKAHYGPDLINDLNWDEWVFNNAGGSMGNMFIIHASISEYLIIFGTTVGLQGHSGVHFADDYFTILSGCQKVGYDNQLEGTTYLPGDCNHLSKGRMTQFAMDEGSYAIELAQGWIPAMLPFGFVEFFTSTLDIETLYRTVLYTGRDMIKNLLNGKF